MLTIHYNNETIPTGLDFSIRINWINPACRMDEVSGNVGLGIDIPVNEYSRAIFGNPERFEKYSTTVNRKFNGFQIRYSGVLLIDGAFNITSATEELYSGWLQSEIGVMGEAQRDKFIGDLDWGVDQDFTNKLVYESGTDDYYALPVKNGGFWNGKGREVKVVREYTDEDGQTHQVGDTINFLTEKFRDAPFLKTVNQYDGQLHLTSGEGCVVSPFLFLRYVIKHILKKNHLFIDRNDMIPAGVDLDLTKYLVIYNNVNIMDPEIITGPMDHRWWDHDSQQWIEDEERVITGFDWRLGKFNYSELLPKIAIRDFVLGLQNYLNYVFCFKKLNKLDIIDRNEILKSEAISLDDYFTGQWIMGEQKDVSLKFTSEYDKEDRMYGQEYHDLTDRLNDFGDPVETKEELNELTNSELGELRLVKNENKIYEFKWKVLTFEDALQREDQKDALGWEFVSSGPQPFVYGDADEIEEIKTCFSTLQFNDNGFFPIPVVLQQGNIRKMKQLWTEFTPRLLNTNMLTAAQPLNWEGEYGLFEVRWKKWARFWKKRLPVEGKFALPMNMLAFVNENIYRKYSTRAGEFVIESMETEFSGTMVGLTTIKGYKI